jgi:FkbM family methyltransferase
MVDTMNETLYNKVKRLDWQPKHVAEVGVYYPETSNVLLFIEDGCTTDLFEPDPQCLQRIRDRFGDYSNVTIHPYAIHSERGTVQLYRAGASTFVKGLPASPALVNDSYQPNQDDLFTAEARLFSEFDDGSIDLISIDVEGSEWFVIQHMVSRPKVISVETGRKRYANPYLEQIRQFMAENGYRRWYRDDSDSVYVHESIKTPLLSRWL